MPSDSAKELNLKIDILENRGLMTTPTVASGARSRSDFSLDRHAVSTAQGLAC